MSENVSSAFARPGQAQAVRWAALAGIVGPLLFLVLYTLAGFLRAGYSPLHQAISDLGVGPNGLFLNISLMLTGLLLIGFAMGFALSMRSLLGAHRQWLIAVLLALHGLGLAAAGIFTEAPATLLLHWLVGATLAFYGPVVAFLVIGLTLLRTSRWHGWGIYSLIASLLTLGLILIMNWLFTPDTPLASMRLGGLMERVIMTEIEAWYIAFGWRLAFLARSQPREKEAVQPARNQ